ncbi:MAG TPA: hypothetical protein PLZ08_05830 [Bacillota bacterium]|nr:hypothetical protein [Bacillota bacterium]HOL11010.1 hypothetical protein [Bacillota bacterium]HPO97463.1 hypothetical protein [Bacillota bacterium]
MNSVNLVFNASGAAEAGRRGDVVVIVDIIDMSTSAEVALEAGAIALFGAAPTNCKAPVNLNPERMGYLAGKTALKHKTQLVVVAEPRYGTEEERRKRAETALLGVARSGAAISEIVPNIGSEINKLVDFKEKVALFVSDTGGVAFDAAFISGAPAVVTATVTRTPEKKGIAPALAGVQRAIEQAQKFDCGISVVAASSNSMEDVLAAQFLVQLIVNQGFLALK